MPLRWLSIPAALVWIALLGCTRTPAQDGLVYGEASGETLTMDYYAPSGAGPHPVAIIIHGGGFVEGTSKNGSEAYCAEFLAPAGYAVFSINYRLAPKYPYPAMLHDVERAVWFIRHHASKTHSQSSAHDCRPGSIAGGLGQAFGGGGAVPEPQSQLLELSRAIRNAPDVHLNLGLRGGHFAGGGEERGGAAPH